MGRKVPGCPVPGCPCPMWVESSVVMAPGRRKGLLAVRSLQAGYPPLVLPSAPPAAVSQQIRLSWGGRWFSGAHGSEIFF